ncbi:hypothetical protein FE783_11950 [Paenibacillus mesophilus]|uniref:hypothetical protein n=1 Tax=Paenibacillus mesophilus TaxID=2582849 RepID=UPI00110DD6B4|nr:hypothetical protein [Paenibacillus mesophilus]TMV50259.1 hypothetical protein FE783_11950 [Paenibacillus mesophilus]
MKEDCGLTSVRRITAAVRIRAVRFARSEIGSYTLESSLIYPTIIIALVSIVFFSMFVYEQASLYYTAATTAERSAFTWDNSAKDWTTGHVLPGRNDGLYWRTGSDGISGMFSFGSGLGLQKVQLPLAEGEAASSGGEGPAGKLLKAANELPDKLDGELTYRHGLIDREVTVRLGQTGVLPFLAGRWTDSRMGAEVRSVVTEPVELIRNVDFVRTFVVRVKDLITKSEAQVIVPPEAPRQQKLVFARAEEAAVYVRSITGGSKVTVATPDGRQRQLDSLDADGLMHEVKLGYTSKSKDHEAQIVKDVELMRQGTQVKGVVWHFFRKEKDGKVGPSKPLRKYLESQGIIVVIHQ